MSIKPLISCLCITKNSAALLNRAIECFESQTYVNKELLVIYESNNNEIATVIAQKKYNNEIRFIETPLMPKLSLGELRNLSISLAKGDFFCQWDDDDWYAANRLELQLQAIEHKHADVCFLGYWILFDHTNDSAYLSFQRSWEGTVFAKKSIVNEPCKYAALPKSEDTFFKDTVEANCSVTRLHAPYLYIYTYHGNNTWDYPHFKHNFELGEKLSNEFSTLLRDILKMKYSIREATKLLGQDRFLKEISDKIIAVDLKTGVDLLTNNL